MRRMKMNKKLKDICLLLLGISLFIIGGFFVKENNLKSISGILIGIGSVLFGMSISNLWIINFNKKHPEELKQAEIEFKDERNTMIRNKAKAKVSDIIQWLVMGIAYITIIINAPLWVTLTVVGVFISKNILELYYMNKYQKTL
jgi:hypothetical protein